MDERAPAYRLDPLPALADELRRADLAQRLAVLRTVLAEPAGDAVGTGDQRVWLVGGTVRDVLLGADTIADIDLVAEADSHALAVRLARATGWPLVTLDERRGTYRVAAPEGSHIDVSALVGDSIEADLAQRDLTINAMALPVVGGVVQAQLIDPLDGLSDLRDELVRLTSPAAAADDPLRLVRVFRFSTALGFIIAPETADEVRTSAALLSRVPAERVLAELALILDDSGSAAVLLRMDETGLLEVVLPEIGEMRGVEQNDFHHLDVWRHSLLALDRFERLLGDLGSVFGEHAERVEAFLRQPLAADRERLVTAKLAVLLHDVGKPETRSTELGRTTFHQHSARGALRAAEAAARLRLSRAETDELAFYVGAHMVPADVETSWFEASGARPGTEAGADRSVVRYVSRRGEKSLVLALIAVADSMAMAGPLADPGRPERLRAFARRAAAAFYEQVLPRAETPPLVRGGELIERFGLEPGPRVGELVGRLRELQLEGTLVTHADALAEAERMLADEGPRPTSDR